MRRRTTTLAATAVALLLAAGCRQDMHDQPRVRPLGESDFWADGQGARPVPAHTVARGNLRADTLYYTGRTAAGQLTATLPPPLALSRELLEHGRDRFTIFCTPCHDSTGSGRGMVVRRGFKQPPPYQLERLRQVPIGHFYDVMTNGFGVMASYASQIPPEDRWAIAAYVRALQLAGGARLGELPAADRARLAALPAADAGAAPESPKP